MSSNSVNLGQINPWSAKGANSTIFAIQQQLAKVNTVTLCQVQAVTTNGRLAGIGQVDVLPLVNQIDGSTIPNGTPYVTVYSLPYLRLQSSSGNGIILDPAVGDVGLMAICSRDISSVKANGGSQSNPGSFRRFSLSDGIYLGAVISSSAPTQYLQFQESGITLASPQQVTVQAPTVTLGAKGGTPQLLATNSLYEWVNNTLLPALATAGITVAAPPSNSVTSATKAS